MRFILCYFSLYLLTAVRCCDVEMDSGDSLSPEQKRLLCEHKALYERMSIQSSLNHLTPNQQRYLDSVAVNRR